MKKTKAAKQAGHAIAQELDEVEQLKRVESLRKRLAQSFEAVDHAKEVFLERQKSLDQLIRETLDEAEFEKTLANNLDSKAQDDLARGRVKDAVKLWKQAIGFLASVPESLEFRRLAANAKMLAGGTDLADIRLQEILFGRRA